MKKISPLPRYAGYIRLIFIDCDINEIITIGSNGFVTSKEHNTAWVNIPVFDGETNFKAQLIGPRGRMIDDKPVSAKTCEILMSKPITDLVENGRIAHYAKYGSLPGHYGNDEPNSPY